MVPKISITRLSYVGLLKYYLCLLLLTTSATYIIQRGLYHQASIKIISQHLKVDRATCCLEGKKDICGRTNCTLPCSNSKSSVPGIDLKNQENGFFIESIHSTLTVRQACAVESLAFLNPNLKIYVLFLIGQVDSSSIIMQTLLKNYPNIRFIKVDFNEFVAGTPMERWNYCSDWKSGPHHVAHLSDGLRYLTLYKFGGYYFDLDVIQSRPVTDYRNFIATEDNEVISIGAMHADKNHPIFQMAVEEFVSNYRLDDWAHNGPVLMARVFKRWCGVKDVDSMDIVRCRGFSVFPESSFYPIYYKSWEEYFIHRKETDKLRWLVNDVIGFHVWNKYSHNEPIYKNSSQFYTQLARMYCPRIISIAPDVF